MAWYGCHPMVDDRCLSLVMELGLGSPDRHHLDPAALMHTASSSLPLSRRY